MRLVTYRKGSSTPRVGALAGDAVLDLGALVADLARERGTMRHGRGGFPRTKRIGILANRVAAP